MIKINQIKLVLAFIIILVPVLSSAGEVDLPKTGQTTCYDSYGNVIDCTNTGQDGDIQAGIEWPEPRFVDNGDGTVTDHLTGLMWLKDANCLGTRNWQGALDVVANFNTNPGSYSCTDYTANYTDWVLPNIVELENLVNAEESNSASWLNTQGFINVQTGCWSASTFAPETPFAWRVYLYDGSVDRFSKFYNYNVLPVRAGQIGPAKTWRTGQTISYATGDDGDLQRGISWPSPRFKDNGDGTITDHLTGLIWLKNANCFGARSWSQALVDCNTLASGSCGLTDGSVAGDWRLHNRKELLSLVDYSRYNPALPQGHLFDNVKSSDYWSATSHSDLPELAFSVSMAYGRLSFWNKPASGSYVWPVRNGSAEAPKLHALIVGVNYLQGIQTGADAVSVYNQLKKYNNWASTNPEPLILDSVGMNNNSLIEQALNDIKLNIIPGDQFVFYFSGHGGFYTGEGGDETPIHVSINPWDFWNKHDEHLETSEYENLSDDTLFSWLNDSVWNNVYKLILLDACHSGGFWGDNNPDDEGDLEKLPKIGLLASSSEESVSFYNQFLGKSPWTIALVSALDMGVNIQNIAQSIANWDWSDIVGENLLLKEDVFPPNGSSLTFDVSYWKPKYFVSDDFSFVLSNPCEGNFDGDNDVDGSDLAVFAADFGRTSCSSALPCEGDFDTDGDVDGSDLATFAADFGRTNCP